MSTPLWLILASLVLLGIFFGILGEMSMGKLMVGEIKPPTPKMPKFGFAGLCLLVAFFIFAIQQGCSVTGNAPSWIWGTVWFLLAIALVLLAIWFWDQTASHHWIRKLLLSLIAIIIIGGFSYIPVAKQYRSERIRESSTPKPQESKTQTPTAPEIAMPNSQSAVTVIQQPPIERTAKFSVMIPFDTAPNTTPIPRDENPNDPLDHTYMELENLV